MAEEETATAEKTDAAEKTTTEDAKPDVTDEKVVTQAEHPDAVKNALAAERKTAREAAKRAEAAEARLAEIEDKDKSELQKAQDKAAKAEQAKVEAEAKLLRFEVASAKGVPSKLVPLLTATSKEGLEEQADLILENAKPADSTDFDGGPRKDPQTKTPEQAHNDTVLELLGRK